MNKIISNITESPLTSSGALVYAAADQISKGGDASWQGILKSLIIVIIGFLVKDPHK